MFEPDERRPDRESSYVALGSIDGSIIQRNSASFAEPGSEPNSSPSTAWPFAPARRSRIACSTAWSASLTGVRSGLVVTTRSVARKRAIVITSASIGELECGSKIRGDIHAGEHTGPRATRYGPLVRSSDEAPGPCARWSPNAAGEFVPDGQTSTIESFVRVYYARAAIDDSASSDVEHLARVAVADWQLGAHRIGGRPVVRVHTPTVASEGWDVPHTLIDIVNDDMPFLVDSVTMAIDRHDLGVHLVVHPVLEVERTDDGTLLGGTRRGCRRTRPASRGSTWRSIEKHRPTSLTASATISSGCSATSAPRRTTG